MQNHLRTACCATLALFLSAGLAGAAEIKLISVGGVKSGLDPIIAAYEKETGNHVNYTAGAPAAVSQRAASEQFDVVVQSKPAMDDLAKANGLKPETRIPVTRGGIGMAVKQGAKAPDISSPDAFKKTLMGASSIGVGDPVTPNGSGVVIERILGASGIQDAIKSKVKVVGLDPGQQMIAKGEIEMGLMNSSEVRDYVTFAGPVPAPMQQYTDYEAAVTTKATAGDAAAAFVKFLASAKAADGWKAGRLEPPAK
jgi:molybdate transport system substrate-binding protein